MMLANESPRFLAMKTPDKALIILSKLRNLPIDHPYVQEEMQVILVGLEEERALASSTPWLTLIKEAFTVKSYFCRSILCITLMMWSNLTGTNAMTYYSPTIFKSVGLSGSSVSLFATGIYGIVKFTACFIFVVFVTDSLGRRKCLLWTGIVRVSHSRNFEVIAFDSNRAWHCFSSASIFVSILPWREPIQMPLDMSLW